MTMWFVQATLFPTPSHFLPNIRTFLGQLKPNVAIIMVRACINLTAICFTSALLLHVDLSQSFSISVTMPTLGQGLHALKQPFYRCYHAHC